MEITPVLPARHWSLYSLIQVEILSICEPFPVDPFTIEKVEDKYLTYPVAQVVYEEKNFGEFY
jgi:hypothetical protein